MTKDLLDALATLTCALAQETGEGDIVLGLHGAAFHAVANAIRGPNPEQVGFSEYVMMAPGGKVTIRLVAP